MMAPIRKAMMRIAARALGILNRIAILRTWTKGVAMAKVIEFYIPKDFRKPVKRVSALRRGKILEFSPQTRKSA